MAALFLAKHLRLQRVFIPSPTWANHKSIWTVAGAPHEEYPYYSSKTQAVEIEGMLATLEEKAKPNDVVILQACAHNPTGVDLFKCQWEEVARVIKRKNLFIVFDSAYQGFATGDVDGDAWLSDIWSNNPNSTRIQSRVTLASALRSLFPRTSAYMVSVSELYTRLYPGIYRLKARNAS
ncbi:hypothetical protein PoHVEF18_005724 [Penicillium ochrochloron]